MKTPLLLILIGLFLFGGCRKKQQDTWIEQTDGYYSLSGESTLLYWNQVNWDNLVYGYNFNHDKFHFKKFYDSATGRPIGIVLFNHAIPLNTLESNDKGLTFQLDRYDSVAGNYVLIAKSTFKQNLITGATTFSLNSKRTNLQNLRFEELKIFANGTKLLK